MLKLLDKILTIIVILLLISAAVWAQAPPPNPTSGAPLDGFTVLLLAASTGYGVKKIRDRRK